MTLYLKKFAEGLLHPCPHFIAWASILLSIVLFSENASAQVPSLVARELVEFVIKKFGKEAIEEAPEVLAKQIDQVVSRVGDNGIEAIRKVGPKAVGWIDDAGEAAPQVAKWVAQHGDNAAWVVANPSRLSLAAKLGDDAAEAMIKLGSPAESILKVGGVAAAKATTQLSPRYARQLAMMADDAADAALVRNEALMTAIAKAGDKGMEFVWKNKGSLAITAVLAAFLANPQPFIDGTQSIAEVAATTAVEPVARGIAAGTNWTFTILAIAATVALYFLGRQWLGRSSRTGKASTKTA